MNDAKPRRKPGRRPRRSGVIAGDAGGESRSGRHQTRRVTSVSAQEGGGERTRSRFASGGEVQEAVCSLGKALLPWRGRRYQWPSGLRASWIRGWAFSSQNGLSLPGRVWGEVARGPLVSTQHPLFCAPPGRGGRDASEGAEPICRAPQEPRPHVWGGLWQSLPAFPAPVLTQWTAAPPGSEKTLAQPAASPAPPGSQGQCWKERSLAGSEKAEETY